MKTKTEPTETKLNVSLVQGFNHDILKATNQINIVTNNTLSWKLESNNEKRNYFSFGRGENGVAQLPARFVRMENGHNLITKEEVIAKLKDDGDFDKLRLEIIRKLKENEKLRESIATVVKQSSVLNQAGSENMKPRQLSDAIREEVGDRLMSQLSDGVWEIIRDEDGMRKEIKETIKCVYNRMLNPNLNEERASSPPFSVFSTQNEAVNGSLAISVNRDDKLISDDDTSEPPGFSLCPNNVEESLKEMQQLSLPQGTIPDERKNEKHNECQDTTKHNGEIAALVSQGTELSQSGDCSDEDPDLPPGFG